MKPLTQQNKRAEIINRNEKSENPVVEDSTVHNEESLLIKPPSKLKQLLSYERTDRANSLTKSATVDPLKTAEPKPKPVELKEVVVNIADEEDPYQVILKA